MNVTRHLILETLSNAPEGMTSAEVIAVIGCASHRAQGMLSKLATYGFIDKLPAPTRNRGGNKAIWRIKSPSIVPDGG